MGANVQVCWEKFCRYWEVEPRLVPMEGETFHLTADRALAHCDENTIGVVAILGSTFDGSYEPIKEIADALDQLESEKGIHIPMHVDAASGGFVAPFLAPDLEWDFRIKRVQSINASGHKYGARLPRRRLGDLARREGAAARAGVQRQLPRRQHADVRAELLAARQRGRRPVLHVHEPRPRGLHGDDAGPAAGRHAHLQSVAEMGPYRLISDGSELPVFAFATNPDVTNYTVFDVSERLRERGWLVPAYTFPENRQDLSVLRVVVRAGMHKEMADELLEALAEKTRRLESLSAPLPPAVASTTAAFAH